MRDLRMPAALFTSSLFLVHCSSGEDTPSNSAGMGGSNAMAGSTMGGSAGTSKGGSGGNPQPFPGEGAGTTNTGGSSGGSAGSASGSGGTGKGGSAGTGAGMAGRGGAGAGGSGAVGAGAAGMAGSSAGKAGGGAAGQGGGSGTAGSGSGMGGKAGGGSGGASGFTLTSTVLTEGGMFPDDTTCDGDNTSPPFTWTAGPSGTMSYAMVLVDTSINFVHWVLWDIPSTVMTLPAALDGMAMSSTVPGAKQKAAQGNGYYGPCPPSGDHVYVFTVYALPVATLSGAMTSEMTSALATDVMNAGPLASATLSAHRVSM
ncbi:MAG TPA: YbhB/YbcL family Raf kinase inhibitor-like protein [Polyangiaceae bacterium]|nr:YbhB/YbcL family Raf kinase inhibitor-like protein [Polyangiaceae bacterium]